MRFRLLQAVDLPECLALLPVHMGLDRQQHQAVCALWPRLMNEPSVITGVVEDSALGVGRRIQAWGVTLVLPRRWADRWALDSAPRAFMSRRIYAALLDGSLIPMNDREIGQENARGELVLFVLHFSMLRSDLDDPAVHKVVAMANDTFRAFHDGYNMHAIYYENSLAADPVARMSGFDPLPFVDADKLDHLDAMSRPALYHLNRVSARSRIPGTPARNCFEHQPPRFRFNASQRKLLWHALFDDADDSLMSRLVVSTHGLKKLWRGIYERIEAVEPEFFGSTPGGDEDGKRGPEKRRQVMAYVRQRPEELRPWASG